jgi:hypothetical protein
MDDLAVINRVLTQSTINLASMFDRLVWEKTAERDEQLDKIYARVHQRAIDLGFCFEEVPVGVSKPFQTWLMGKRSFACYYRTFLENGSGYIVFHRCHLTDYWTKNQHGDIQMVMAHELGHAIDLQFRRDKNHPFIRRMDALKRLSAIQRAKSGLKESWLVRARRLSWERELFANAFVGYLYGIDAVVSAQRILGDDRVTRGDLYKVKLGYIRRR